jgi:hypothetical protein
MCISQAKACQKIICKYGCHCRCTLLTIDKSDCVKSSPSLNYEYVRVRHTTRNRAYMLNRLEIRLLWSSVSARLFAVRPSSYFLITQKSSSNTETDVMLTNYWNVILHTQLSKSSRRELSASKQRKEYEFTFTILPLKSFVVNKYVDLLQKVVFGCTTLFQKVWISFYSKWIIHRIKLAQKINVKRTFLTNAFNLEWKLQSRVYRTRKLLQQITF